MNYISMRGLFRAAYWPRFLLGLAFIFLAACDRSPRASSANPEFDALRAHALLSGTDPGKKDSVLDLLIRQATLQGSDTALYELLNLYCSRERFTDTARAREYIADMLEIATRTNNDSWLCDAYCARTRFLLAQGDFEGAESAGRQAHYYATLRGSSVQTGKVMLLLGQAQERSRNMTEAFRSYMNALYEGDKAHDQDLEAACYKQLAAFYVGIDDYEKAKSSKRKELNLVLSNRPEDTAAWMRTQSELADIFFNNHEPVQGRALTRQIVQYAESHHDDELRRMTFTRYRTWLISNNRFAELERVYRVEYPEELERIARTDSLLYNRLMAIFAEERRDNKQAAIHYARASEIITRGDHNAAFVANFHRRYGQFLLRDDQIEAAEQRLDTAYAYAAKAQWLPYLADIADLLDSVARRQGQYEAAYRYAHEADDYRQAQLNAAQQDKLLLLELDNESKRRDLQRARAEEATRHRHNLQYTGMVWLITATFIFLALLGSFKLPRLVIRAAGYLSFILLFEFIILLIDHKLHEMTHGEPWKILACKIVIIGVLLPFHHWIEEKAVHYLTTHRLINPGRFSFWRLARKGEKADVVSGELAPSSNEARPVPHS